MGDAIALVDDILHGDAGDRAEIERLAAGGRIKGRAVEVDDGAALRGFDGLRLKAAQVGIVVIQALSHRKLLFCQKSHREPAAYPHLWVSQYLP